MTFRRILTTFSLSLTAIMAFTVVAPVGAQVQSSIEGGDIYRVRNLTKGGAFADPATADKCDELQYRIRIHNPGPDAPLQNVTVKVVIPGAASTSNVSTATVSSSNASPSSVSDTATVNLAAAYKVTYVAGSAQILNADGGLISSTGDVTSGTGVNIGTVGISIGERRFVQFRALVDCPQPPPPAQPEQPQPPKKDQDTTTPVGTTTPRTPSTPSSLPATGAADTALLVALVTIGSAASYYYLAARRTS